MKILFDEYKNKLLGCWWGKYVAGTLGAPLEGVRGTFDVNNYLQDDPSGVPNDDVDLQLISLRACEDYYNRVDSHILAEYWLTYLASSISEYGAAKNNLSNHILPPLSGRFNNPCKESCASFIRSEIWSCLCAGNPDVAVRYALEDASIDHSKEGIFGEIFCAALQSYAFIENDIFKLIDKSLSYIPNDCDVAKAVNCVLKSYKNNLSWKEARSVLLTEVPGSFGICYNQGELSVEDKKLPKSKDFYDAPSNIGLGILGLIYGENDFEKTICITVGCGEDADCSGGFAGATIGIILGYEALPKKWLSPLNNKIVTCCLAGRDNSFWPQTIEELVERIIKLTPLFLPNAIDYLETSKGYSIKILSEQELLYLHSIRQTGYLDLKNYPIKLSPVFSSSLKRIDENMGVRFNSVLFETIVNYKDSFYIKENDSIKIEISFWNNLYMQQTLNIRTILPDGISLNGSTYFTLFLDQVHGGYNSASKELEFKCNEIHSHFIEIILEIESIGRATKQFVPITLQAQ